MDEKQFYKEMERNYKALIRLNNVLKADLLRLEDVVGPEGQEILRETHKVGEVLNYELKNLQKLLKLVKPKSSQ